MISGEGKNLEGNCSCRKRTWYGIVCRHLLAVLRRLSILKFPISWYHPRWFKDEYQVERRKERRVEFYVGSWNVEATGLTGEEKISELSSVTKYLLMRALDDEEVFSIVENSVKTLESSVKAIQEAKSPHNQDGLSVRNPLRIKTKGRPRQSVKRKSQWLNK